MRMFFKTKSKWFNRLVFILASEREVEQRTEFNGFKTVDFTVKEKNQTGREIEPVRLREN